MSTPETPAARSLRLALTVISCAGLAVVPAAVLAGAFSTFGSVGISAGAWMACLITAACSLVRPEGSQRRAPRACRHQLGQ